MRFSVVIGILYLNYTISILKCLDACFIGLDVTVTYQAVLKFSGDFLSHYQKFEVSLMNQ